MKPSPFNCRAWYKGDPEFDEEGCMCHNVHLIYDGYNGGLDREDDPLHVLGGMESFGELLQDKRFVVMRSTGLIDYNGKEIFQSDHVMYRGSKFEVVWCNGAFKLMETTFFGSDIWLHELLMVCTCNREGKVGELEVVGNSYEKQPSKI